MYVIYSSGIIIVLANKFLIILLLFFFFQAEDGIRDDLVTGVQTCALPIFYKLSEFVEGG